MAYLRIAYLGHTSPHQNLLLTKKHPHQQAHQQAHLKAYGLHMTYLANELLLALLILGQLCHLFLLPVQILAKLGNLTIGR